MLKDLVRRRDVGEISVSHVMRDSPNTSARPRERAVNAAHERNYMPNRLTGVLVSISTYPPAVIVVSISHSVRPKVLDGIDSVLNDTRFRTELGTTRHDQEREREIVTDLLEWNPAGVILTEFECSPARSEQLERVANPMIESMDAGG